MMKKKAQEKNTFTLTIHKKHRIAFGNRGEERIIHKSAGRTSGLGVCAFAAMLLKMNEGLPKFKKLTDQEITRQMVMEFPHLLEKKRSSIRRLAVGEIGVGYYRSHYNSGRFTNGRPDKRSVKYDLKGNPVVLVRGRPCRRLTEKDAREREKEQGYWESLGLGIPSVVALSLPAGPKEE